jgi:NAD(P)H-nitrite reductase large subunit
MAAPERDPDQTICFCHNVPYKRLLEAIRSGATTIQAIQDKTRASTGCGGCESEVSEILHECEGCQVQVQDALVKADPK